MSRGIAASFLLGAVFASCAGAVAARTPDQSTTTSAVDPAPGKALYDAACMSCHGPDGRGMPRSAVGFDIPVPDFTDCSFATPEPDVDWLIVVKHGGPIRAFDRRMPAFGAALTEQEIGQILGYIRGMCADTAWPRGELNLPRPLRTEKAFPENEAVVSATIDSTGAGAFASELIYERRLGSRSQYEIKIPFELNGNTPDGWQRGLGDLAIGFKRVMAHSLKRGAILSAGAEVIFPTGKEERGLGAGTTVFEPFVLFGQMLPRDTFLQAHAGLELPADRDAAANEAFVRVAAGRTFAQGAGAGRAWSPMIELLAARELRSGERTTWDVVPQVQVTLPTRQHIAASAGVQLPLNQRKGRGARLLVYLLWDWFDGGFFDGW
jgi:mono/diheme cytochrome c family protein